MALKRSELRSQWDKSSQLSWKSQPDPTAGIPREALLSPKLPRPIPTPQASPLSPPPTSGCSLHSRSFAHPSAKPRRGSGLGSQPWSCIMPALGCWGLSPCPGWVSPASAQALVAPRARGARSYCLRPVPTGMGSSYGNWLRLHPSPCLPCLSTACVYLCCSFSGSLLLPPDRRRKAWSCSSGTAWEAHSKAHGYRTAHPPLHRPLLPGLSNMAIWAPPLISA